MITLTPFERVVRDELIEIAKSANPKLITYLELGVRVDPDGERERGPIPNTRHSMFGFNEVLGHISMYEVEHGRPMITALVVQRETGTPGEGFSKLARHLGFESEDPIAFWQRECAEVNEFGVRLSTTRRGSWTVSSRRSLSSFRPSRDSCASCRIRADQAHRGRSFGPARQTCMSVVVHQMPSPWEVAHALQRAFGPVSPPTMQLSRDDALCGQWAFVPVSPLTTQLSRDDALCSQRAFVPVNPLARRGSGRLPSQCGRILNCETAPESCGGASGEVLEGVYLSQKPPKPPSEGGVAAQQGVLAGRLGDLNDPADLLHRPKRPWSRPHGAQPDHPWAVRAVWAVNSRRGPKNASIRIAHNSTRAPLGTVFRVHVAPALLRLLEEACFGQGLAQGLG